MLTPDEQERINEISSMDQQYYPEEDVTDLLEIIDDRVANKATIITSQLPIEHWHAWVGDATIADAILDRLMQQNHRLTLTGESLRQKPETTQKEKNANPSGPTFLESERETQNA